MTLHTRLVRLERNRPQHFAAAGLECDLHPDLCARIAAAKAVGTFPQSLAAADLEAIMAAADKAKGET